MVHVRKESPAAHLCTAASGAQAQRNQTHRSMQTLAFSRTFHFRGKCTITPRNCQPFLSNTLLHSTDTALLQESSLSHPLLCKPLPMFFLSPLFSGSQSWPFHHLIHWWPFLCSSKWMPQTPSSWNMFAFDRNFAVHPSQGRMVHTSWRWKGLGNRAWCWCDSVGPLCTEGEGEERWCSYGEQGQVGSVYQCCYFRCLWRRNNKY